MNLYKLTDEIKAIHEKVAENEGELTEELELQLDSTSLAIKDKVSGIAKWTLNLDADIKAIKEEKERLTVAQKQRENLKTRLKEYMKLGMINANLKKLELPTMTISVNNNPPSVELDGEYIEDKYYRKEIVVTTDKKKIMVDLKAGVKVHGARLVTDKTNLKIK